MLQIAMDRMLPLWSEIVYDFQANQDCILKRLCSQLQTNNSERAITKRYHLSSVSL